MPRFDMHHPDATGVFFAWPFDQGQAAKGSHLTHLRQADEGEWPVEVEAAGEAGEAGNGPLCGGSMELRQRASFIAKTSGPSCRPVGRR
jgi:hypothetical protein